MQDTSLYPLNILSSYASQQILNFISLELDFLQKKKRDLVGKEEKREREVN